MVASYYIGTSGWHYPHWQRRFYPRDLAPPAWLEYYARHFATVEINRSFYRRPSLATARAYSSRAQTSAWLIEQFLPVRITAGPAGAGQRIAVTPC